MKIHLPQRPWHGNTLLEIDLPDSWETQVCPMKGADYKALSPGEIQAAIAEPGESSRLETIARGKQSAVIVFDDMTRPTRASEIVPFLLEELSSAGISARNITFVCALGAHGALNMQDFRKKLGPDIPENYRVFNHNPYENCIHLGETAFGIPVAINRAVMEADVKIGISCVTAHSQTGFSGGGKLLVPGTAHIDTIAHLHMEVAARAPETTGPGKHEGNVLRENIEQAAAMVKMDFCINVIVNGRGETTAVFAGSPEASHQRATEHAKIVYATHPRPRDKDVVIANAFAKANEMPIAVRTGIMALAGGRGVLAVIADAPEGQVAHYLLGRFGLNYGGRRHPASGIPEGLDLIVMAPCFDKTFGDWFKNPETATWTRTWEETLAVLEQKAGPNSRAAVLPNATMQYLQAL